MQPILPLHWHGDRVTFKRVKRVEGLKMLLLLEGLKDKTVNACRIIGVNKKGL